MRISVRQKFHSTRKSLRYMPVRIPPLSEVNINTVYEFPSLALVAKKYLICTPTTSVPTESVDKLETKPVKPYKKAYIAID